jgi:hypothetical protein
MSAREVGHPIADIFAVGCNRRLVPLGDIEELIFHLAAVEVRGTILQS